MTREEQLIALVKHPIARFERLTAAKVVVDIADLDEAFRRIMKTLQEGFPPVKKPSALKVAGAMCFWIRKLKPFSIGKSISAHPMARQVNEALAFMIAYDFVFGAHTKWGTGKKPNISPIFFKDLVASLRYHSHSPHSLVLLFEALSL